ncbi:Eco57I restriction-modification methylase domain-containing protein [uncultured Dysgonomonas sp.]|uniref:Eco57I restriction-modification methylase domain-containing protein n=1 Tax=uncultured Dysgonomonas sp. TaxID=206096 RepID=UPI002804B408|nr:N-6 DNA methylase [uncultured Dysgonomonas sp.]
MMNNLSKNTSISDYLKDGLKKLGFISETENDSLLFFIKERENYSSTPEIWFQLEKASLYKADAVFFKKGIKDNDYIAQIYIYDRTSKNVADLKEVTEIHKNIWTGGDIPIVCIFSKTEIKILDTTKPIVEKKGVFSPEYLIENLKNISVADKIYNESFAQKIKSGTYWDNSNVDFNKHSAYSKLTALLRRVIDKFTLNSGLKSRKDIVQKLIIQCILVKYLEEREDRDGNRVFPKEFFKKYNNATQFSDVLENGDVFAFFKDLNDNHFNGGIFHWERDVLKLFDGKVEPFTYLSKVLRGYLDTNDQQLIEFEDNFSRLYSFNFIPVELISRLYEEFIIKDEEKEKGVAYTPAHLVRLLVNEAMPINTPSTNLENFKILDPACGSAIFLVVAFKRIVEWWRINNNYNKPTLENLKTLLRAVYGVDLDPKAVQISIFSLCIALCDELSPKEIWYELKFDRLEENQIFTENFFDWTKKHKNLEFDIVIGNPPFVRGGLETEYKTWRISENLTVEIPQNQIALKFLAESLLLLKKEGLSCLIIKSSPLLYSNSNNSKKYLKALTHEYYINQIFDFTALARNGVLWDGVDVDTAAIFVTNKKPDFETNVLHAVFRRTKANKERIYFEIDKYDLHFILRQDIYSKAYVYKMNLLGGGRISNLLHRLSYYKTLFESKELYNIEIEEGFEINKDGNNNPDFLYELRTLPSCNLGEEGITIPYEDFPKMDKSIRFSKSSNEIIFRHPNILIKENISLPIIYNKTHDFSFPRKIIGIASNDKDQKVLDQIYHTLIKNKKLYQFFIAITSAQVLVIKNSALYFEDIKRLPLAKDSFELSDTEKNVINDVLDYTQYFIRRPETATALKALKDAEKEIIFYGNEFSKAINELYADNKDSFKLTNIIHFQKENLIGVLFSYDESTIVVPQIITENELTGINGLTNFNINESLSATRIIQYYAPNKVLFVKPNQKRYWLASIAYRDADSVFADILNNQ